MFTALKYIKYTKSGTHHSLRSGGAFYFLLSFTLDLNRQMVQEYIYIYLTPKEDRYVYKRRLYCLH